MIPHTWICMLSDISVAWKLNFEVKCRCTEHVSHFLNILSGESNLLFIKEGKTIIYVSDRSTAGCAQSKKWKLIPDAYMYLWLVSTLYWLMSCYMKIEDQIHLKCKVMISNVNSYGFADILT